MEHHFDFLSLKGGCIGLSECTHVEMPNCLKSHVMAQVYFSASVIAASVKPQGCHVQGKSSGK